MSLDDTTTVRNWLWTTCRTNLVSVSSCVDFRGPRSAVPVDDLTSSSSVNPPAPTIYLPTGAGEHNFQSRNVLDLFCYQPMTDNSTSSLVEVHHDLPQAI